MNEQQKANLLLHATFMDSVVVTETNSLNMSVYYSFDTDKMLATNIETRDLLDDEGNFERLSDDNPCGFCACVIG